MLTQYGSAGEYKAGMAALKRKLMEWGMCWRQRFRADHVGVDGGNRLKLGVTGSDAQHHGDEINQLGYTRDELRAWCKQASQWTPQFQRDVEWNAEQVRLNHAG